MVDETMTDIPPHRNPYKRLFVIMVVVVALLIGVGVFFIVLVGQNARQLNSNTATNQVDSAQLVTANDPVAGNPESGIVIVEFSDFQCPFCKEAFPIVRQLISEYQSKIKFVFRDFPISDSHPQAQKAAEAGQCAHAQGKFWEMHDKLFLNQGDLTVPALKRYAQEIGLDTGAFNQCLDNGEKAVVVQQDFNDGVLSGVDGTPTFFINGTRFAGVLTMDNFKTAIDQLTALGY